MSKISIIIIIVVVIVVAGGAWWYISYLQRPITGVPAQQSTAVNNVQNAPVVSGGNTPDNSDAAINGDLSAIDSQMNNLNTDSNNIDQSLTNQ